MNKNVSNLSFGIDKLFSNSGGAGFVNSANTGGSTDFAEYLSKISAGNDKAGSAAKETSVDSASRSAAGTAVKADKAIGKPLKNKDKPKINDIGSAADTTAAKENGAVNYRKENTRDSVNEVGETVSADKAEADTETDAEPSFSMDTEALLTVNSTVIAAVPTEIGDVGSVVDNTDDSEASNSVSENIGSVNYIQQDIPDRLSAQGTETGNKTPEFKTDQSILNFEPKNIKLKSAESEAEAVNTEKQANTADINPISVMSESKAVKPLTVVDTEAAVSFESNISDALRTAVSNNSENLNLPEDMDVQADIVSDIVSVKVKASDEDTYIDKEEIPMLNAKAESETETEPIDDAAAVNTITDTENAKSAKNTSGGDKLPNSTASAVKRVRVKNVKASVRDIRTDDSDEEMSGRDVSKALTNVSPDEESSENMNESDTYESEGFADILSGGAERPRAVSAGMAQHTETEPVTEVRTVNLHNAELRHINAAQAVENTIAQNALNMAGRIESKTMELMLNPRELGKIVIKMQSTAAGLNIKIIADNLDINKGLEMRMLHMEDTLKAQGVTLNNIEIEHSSVSENSMGFAGFQNSAREFDGFMNQHSSEKNSQSDYIEYTEYSYSEDEDMAVNSESEGIWRAGNSNVEFLA